MSHVTYTAEEFKKMLQTLFLEKRKVKELQRQLQDLDKEREVWKQQEALSLRDGNVREMVEKSQQRSVQQYLEKLQEKERELRESQLEVQGLQAALKEKELQGVQEKEEAASAGRQFSAKLQELALALKSVKKKNDEEGAARTALETQIIQLNTENGLLKEREKALQNVQESAHAHFAEVNQRLIAAEVEGERLKMALRLSEQEKERQEKELEQLIQQNKSFERLQEEWQQTQKALETLAVQDAAKEEALKAAETQLALLSQKSAELMQARLQINEFEQLLGREKERFTLLEKERDAVHAKQQALQAQLSQDRETFLSLQTVLSTAQHEKALLQQTLLEKEEQITELKQMHAALREEHKNYAQRLEAFMIQMDTQNLEKKQLKEEAQLKEMRLKEIEKELEEIKQALVQGMREAKNLEARFVEGVHEKAALLHKYQVAMEQLEQKAQELETLQAEIERTKGELQLFRHTEEELKRANEELRHSIEQLSAQLLEAELLQKKFVAKEREWEAAQQEALNGLAEKDQKWAQVLAVREQELLRVKAEYAAALEAVHQQASARAEELERRLALAEESKQIVKQQAEQAEEKSMQQQLYLAEERQKYQALAEEFKKQMEQLGELRHQVEDGEARFQVAQQYLAKKVKETAALRDLIDQEKMQVQELQNERVQQKNLLAQVQANLEMQLSLANEKAGTAETRAANLEQQTAQWQNKYFVLHERWQQDKARLAELEKIKAEYDQVATMVAGIKTMMHKGGGEAAASLGAAPLFGEATNDLPLPPQPAEQAVRLGPDLFSALGAESAFKRRPQTLFEVDNSAE